MGVAEFALVDWLASFAEALLDGQIGRQFGIGDVDQVERSVGGLFVDRGHGRDRVADITDFFDAQRLLVLADRQDAVLDRQVAPSDHAEHARQCPRRGRTDGQNVGVRPSTAQESAKGHAWQLQIVGVARRASGFGQSVWLR